ncbi:hypothetical protein P3X46_016205 [Hevea brasiliensis]|uniref:Gamma-interferon-inducible lysosomal thiol reductase n=1 Tax=Hevea brasiliensis TaxID=3981 RepID=A0ABQ9LYD6_HEVBR|nr:gamma-interferon-responsive lysosomal thiol protein [Hevea brasiliensis]KAJ9173029.1 hypothetical protein P3X46_016205 [Hevea brasiliensis]
MASGLVLFFFFLSSLLFLFVSSSHFSSSGNNVAMKPAPPFHSQKKAVANPEKVSVSLYYETLCPYCRNFILDPLAKAIKTDLMTILDLQLVPWGNAMILPDSTVSCQHGEDECYLNSIHACVIDIWPDVIMHFNLIQCIEEQSSAMGLGNGAEALYNVCAEQLGFPAKPIKDCHESARGRELLLQYGSRTDSLNPPHRYVPWVVVNGNPLLENYDNFVEYVCKSYRGKSLPTACVSYPTSSVSKERSLHSVCPAGLARPAKHPARVQENMESLA